MGLAYFDCFSGAAGDMIVGSLVDAGADAETLKAAVMGLGNLEFSVDFETVHRGSIAGTKFNVTVPAAGHEHRNLHDILEIIDSAGLAKRPADRAKRIFNRLAEAEAHAHRIDIDKVHFHEVGAVDSIVDVVAAALAMEQLDIDRVLCSPVAVGSGSVTCLHGTLPVPAPATARLLVGAATVQADVDGEITTPTGAAVLTALSESFGPMPAMKISSIGYGAGTRQQDKMPNLLRVFVGKADENAQVDSVVELCANIDDCTGEIIGATIDMLLAEGALDAWSSPITMKKSRPAWTLSAICTEADVERIEGIIFTETTTLGIRRRRCTRSKLIRCTEIVQTQYGPIRIKIGMYQSQPVTAGAEFADCQAAARTHNVSAAEVMAAAVAAYRRPD